jgi:hypothetical protein
VRIWWQFSFEDTEPRTVKAQKNISKQKYVSVESRAHIYVGLGENDKALE